MSGAQSAWVCFFAAFVALTPIMEGDSLMQKTSTVSSLLGKTLTHLIVAVLGMALLSATWWLVHWTALSVDVRLGNRFVAIERNICGHTKDRSTGNYISLHSPAEPRGVLISSLEHVVPTLGIKVIAGGLGNMLHWYLKHAHAARRPYKFVFAAVGDQDYSRFIPARPLLDGCVQVRVFRDPAVPHVEHVALHHEKFLARTTSSVYPDGRRRQDFVEFFALWNAALAELLVRGRADGEIGVHHCLDYHSTLAPWYTLHAGGDGAAPFPTALTLHNAYYQGSFLAVLSLDEWRTVSRTLGLPSARSFCELEGDLNLLHAGVAYVRQRQGGVGITAVSTQYASQLQQADPLYDELPIGGHPNPVDDPPALPAHGGASGLPSHKALCKAATQRALGLAVDPDALLVGFVGRWTHEKGIDLVMDAACWLLSRPAADHVQLYLVGPIGDEVGHLAAMRLQLLGSVPFLRKRLFVAPRFYQLTAEMRYATDFCLCPSRIEPFGFVDVEFARHGALTIGQLTGGLGKVPGIYYRAFEHGDRLHLLGQLKRALAMALRLPAEARAASAQQATEVRFPFAEWSAALDEQYKAVLRAAAEHGASAHGVINGTHVGATTGAATGKLYGSGAAATSGTHGVGNSDARGIGRAQSSKAAQLPEMKEPMREPLVGGSGGRPSESLAHIESAGLSGEVPADLLRRARALGSAAALPDAPSSPMPSLRSALDLKQLLHSVELGVVHSLLLRPPQSTGHKDVDEIIETAHVQVRSPPPQPSSPALLASPPRQPSSPALPRAHLALHRSIHRVAARGRRPRARTRSSRTGRSVRLSGCNRQRRGSSRSRSPRRCSLCCRCSRPYAV